MGNVLSILILLALAGLFIFLAVRAARARRGWIKWPGMLLSGLLGLLFLAVTVVALVGFYRLNRAPYTYQVSSQTVALTPEKVARGERLAHPCADCHSSTGSLPLDGSKDNFMAGGPPAGVLYAPNLTPGGPLKDWTDGEILRAIREGVDKDGRPLMIMPSQPFHYLSDEDAGALVAYLRSQPAIQRDLPRRDLNVLAALFIGSGMFPTSAQPPLTGPVVAPQTGTPEYGKYLAYAVGCRDCHGPDFTGGSGGNGPGGPNLTAIVPSWTEAQFVSFFRTGVDPSGRKVDPQVMPWKPYGQAFTDAELKDLFSFLRGLEQTAGTK